MLNKTIINSVIILNNGKNDINIKPMNPNIADSVLFFLHFNVIIARNQQINNGIVYQDCCINSLINIVVCVIV